MATELHVVRRPVRLRAGGHGAAHGRPAVRGRGARGGRRQPGARGRDVPPEPVAPAQDAHLAPERAALAAAGGDPEALLPATRAAGRWDAAVPVVPYGP